MKGLFITGTDTHAGKTWFAVRLIRFLTEQGISVVPRKPVESGWQEDVTLTDAWQLAKAAHMTEHLDEVCPLRFKRAVSPARAALEENVALRIEQLTRLCTNALSPDSVVIVEGAGGFYSPIATDGLNADLAVELNLPVILVADNRLGSINQVLLATEAIHSRGLNLTAIILNNQLQTEESIRLAQDNLHDLAKLVETKLYSFIFQDENTKVLENLSNNLFTSITLEGTNSTAS